MLAARVRRLDWVTMALAETVALLADELVGR